jgi:LmbE family N-acetylglucosaminyl deacetylase
MKLQIRWLLMTSLLASCLPAGPVVWCGSFSVQGVDTRPADRATASDAGLQGQRGIPGLTQALRDLTEPFSVMFVAAKPSDEDTGLLTYYRRRLGARTDVVFATDHADDSPDRPPPDAGAEDRRAVQALRSARIEGADVYFLNLPSSGKSKNADEVLSAWGRDKAIGRLVAAIRLLKPDVIVTRAPGLGSGPAVQAAVGELSAEAFGSAADTSKYTDAGPAWRPSRLFQSTDSQNAQVTTNLKEYDRLWGLTYLQLAESARGAYRRGGSAFGIAPRSYYKLVRAIEGDAFKAGATMVDGLTMSKELAEAVSPPVVFDAGPRGPTEPPNAGGRTLEEAIGRPAALIDALMDRLVVKQVEVTQRSAQRGTQGGAQRGTQSGFGIEAFREKIFVETLEKAIALVLGISIEVDLSDRVVIPGENVVARVKVSNGTGRMFGVELETPQVLPVGNIHPDYKSQLTAVPANEESIRQYDYRVPTGAPLTVPHRTPIGEGYYPAGSAPPGWDERYATGAELRVLAKLVLGGTTATIPAVVQFDIAPELEMSVAPPIALIKDWSTSRTIFFTVDVVSRIPGLTEAELWVVPLGIVKDDYLPTRVEFSRKEPEVKVALAIEVPVLKPPLGTDILIELRRPGTGPSQVLRSVKIPAVAAELGVAPGIDVGLISRPDDPVSLGLDELGVQHHRITEDDLKYERQAADLDRFQAIIVGSFAYHAVTGLARYNDRLLEYARRGGNLIVFPQNPSEWNASKELTGLAPYPLYLSALPVEQAEKLAIAIPDGPPLSVPNKLGSNDIRRLLQTGALYVPAGMANAYQSLISLEGSPDSSPISLVARAEIGFGTYTYTAFNWGPALDSLDPGAYRLLADLIGVDRGAGARPSAESAPKQDAGGRH